MVMCSRLTGKTWSEASDLNIDFLDLDKMDPVLITVICSAVLSLAGLIVNLFSKLKKSSCCGGEMLFETAADPPSTSPPAP